MSSSERTLAQRSDAPLDDYPSDVTSGWAVPRTCRREWIAPPNLPDESTVESLREILRTKPRIVRELLAFARSRGYRAEEVVEMIRSLASA